MATINEIKNLIKTKIEGQGSQVDIGNGLPSVLNGMADLIQQTQEFISKGYLFVGCFNEEDLPEFPETDTNHYFAFVWHGEYFSFWQWEKENGWDTFYTEFNFQPIITLEDLETYKNKTTPEFYITPKCLVDYVKSLYFDFNELDWSNPYTTITVEQIRRLRNAIKVTQGTEPLSRIDGFLNYSVTDQGGTTLVTLIDNVLPDTHVRTISGVWGAYSLSASQGKLDYVYGFAIAEDTEGDSIVISFGYEE